MKARRIALMSAVAASVLSQPVVSEMRIAHFTRPLTDRWLEVPVAPRRGTRLGIRLRPHQPAGFWFVAPGALETLLAYPFQILRLGAYWNRMEPEPCQFCPDSLDWQVDAAERAGKQIVVCVGAVKTFGYPEFFVPAHHLGHPLPEGRLIDELAYRPLLAAATAFITRVVERYRDRKAIVAWQVEHEAVDPLGMEHSWRLATAFVQKEVEAVRTADSTRPIILNGFLPTSLPVRLQQWWRTRDQGDSLSLAQRQADILGVDFYPRHALLRLGPGTLYLDGSRSRWQQRRRRQLSAWAKQEGRRLMVVEGQAEPWETTTTPPNPAGRGMYSCLPEQVVITYNQCLGDSGFADLHAYLFWGAEYWVLRAQCDDRRYLQAFARILENA